MNLLYTVLNLEITTEHTPGVSAIKSSCKRVIEVYIIWYSDFTKFPRKIAATSHYVTLYSD